MVTKRNKEDDTKTLFKLIYGEPNEKEWQLTRLIKVMNKHLSRKERRALLLNNVSICYEMTADNNKTKHLKDLAVMKMRHPFYQKYVLGKKDQDNPLSNAIEDYDLSVRTINGLRKVGIMSMNDLENTKFISLIDNNSLNTKSLKEIADCLVNLKNIKKQERCSKQ